MKLLLFVTAIVFAMGSAFAHQHEAKKKIIEGHDKEHHHVDGTADHEHDDTHHKDHDHKAHHADHDDSSHGHDKNHKHVDTNKDHDVDETHHEKVKTKPKK